MNLPYLVFVDSKGKIYHHPFLRMLGRSLDKDVLPKPEELIRIPKGSSFFYLPARLPIGFNLKTKKIETLEEFKGRKVFALAAFPIPGYLRLYTPSAKVLENKVLSLWAYTACGFSRGSFYITAVKVDRRIRQSPRFYDNQLVKKGVKFFLKHYPKNRLYRHLAHCALNYNCLTAKNLFLQRWEAPLPTARTCNARCLGCLSFQDKGPCASHNRINFSPTPDEIFQVMFNHLKTAPEAITSFGQGCEGEPLLEADLIAKSIYKVRERISRGTINMNTNASLPKEIKILCQTGIDSFRVSLNSPSEKFYNLYFKPRGYRFKDVLKSIATAKKYKKFVSVNLFIFPGFSDSKGEIKQLIRFIRDTGIDMIQWRNLNIDPESCRQLIPDKNLKAQGVLNLLATIKKEFSKLKFGYFNLPKESFKTFQNI